MDLKAWALLGLVLAVGFLIWRGTGSILKAIFGGIFVPLTAFTFVAMIVPRSWIEAVGGWGLLGLVVLTLVYAVWANARP